MIRINVQISKTYSWVSKLIDMGYEIISWSDLLYSSKTIKAEKVIKLYQAGCNPDNLLGVAYKNGALIEFEGNETDSEARLGFLKI